MGGYSNCALRFVFKCTLSQSRRKFWRNRHICISKTSSGTTWWSPGGYSRAASMTSVNINCFFDSAVSRFQPYFSCFLALTQIFLNSSAVISVDCDLVMSLLTVWAAGISLVWQLFLLICDCLQLCCSYIPALLRYHCNCLAVLSLSCILYITRFHSCCLVEPKWCQRRDFTQARFEEESKKR